AGYIVSRYPSTPSSASELVPCEWCTSVTTTPRSLSHRDTAVPVAPVKRATRSSSTSSTSRRSSDEESARDSSSRACRRLGGGIYPQEIGFDGRRLKPQTVRASNVRAPPAVFAR